MATKKKTSDPEQYTKPDLREKLKNEIIAGDKGGRPGQWSARKAQLLVQEYEKAGGGYKKGRTEKQQSLRKWGDEKWTTSDGSKATRKSSTKRYLPEKAWEQLTPAQKKATDKKKQASSRKGKQLVANTEPAAKAGKKVRSSPAKKKTSQRATKKTARKSTKRA